MSSNDQRSEAKLRNEFTAFMEIVLKHAKIDYLRIYIRRQSREELFDALPEKLLISEDSFASDIGQRFHNKILDRAFDSLPEARQKILTCFFVHKMNAREIADVYGYSEKYVYKLKYAALETLRKHMADMMAGGDDDE